MTEFKVYTAYGTYIGKRNACGTIPFKGIHYAKAPVGALRWKAPVKPDPGNQVYDAADFGFSCVQPVDPVELASVRAQSEDCLSLNVWTREVTGSERPVMVFIHGGGYIGGGSSDPVYDGENFVNRKNIVLVTINYRCNVLGFMDLEDFGGADYAHSKNLGILDQICALEWIRDNIAYFGGDPGNVTIFGESAGSASVSLLMASPAAKGLFGRVIAQSGAMIMYKEPEAAKRCARDFIRISKVADMNALLAMKEGDIREICVQLMKEYGCKSEIMFAPVADGRIIPRDPYESVKSGCAEGVALIVGTNADELNYWKYYYDDIEEKIMPFTRDQFEIIGPDIGKYGDLMEIYLNSGALSTCGHDPIDLAVELLFRIPSIKLAELQSQFGDTRMYCFTWPSRIDGLGACHAVDLPFVFHTLESESGLSFTGEDPPEHLAAMVQDAWASFAAKGDPTHAGIPEWPLYDTRSRATMFIDEEWHVEEDPGREERLLLRKIFE